MKTSEIVLDDWQKEVLAHNGSFVLCTGRQVGKTTIMAIKASEYALRHPDSQIIIVSLTEDQAKLMIVMILDYIEKKYKKFLGKGKNRATQNKVTLLNGSRIIARPIGTTGDSLRGFTGSVLILDECSRMNETIMTAAKPVLLTTGGQIWICSTPYGKRGYFWEAFQNKNGRFRVFHKSSIQVIESRTISKGWTETKRAEAIKFLEEEKREMSALQFGQEYEGLFLDDIQQYFSDELIAKSCTYGRKTGEEMKGHVFLGVDIARMGGDECAYEILERSADKNRVYHVESITKTKQFTTQTETDILALNQLWKITKIGIDAGSGSLGVSLFDRFLENPLTKNKIIAMNNRDISLDSDGKSKMRIFKEDMYDNLLNMMEKGEIVLLDDEKVKLSLKSIQWEFYSPNEAEKGVTTKIRIFGNYSHITEGLVRAAWLAKKEKINKVWISYV